MGGRAPADCSVPLVSIGMPVYNDRRFLRDSIDSLCAQTFKDFELILRDDGSTDGSAEICLDYCARDPRIRYVRNERNLGISQTMQLLLAEARGEFFMWAADDDLWDESFIERLVDSLRDAPDCIVSFCPYALIDEDGVRFGMTRAIDYSAKWAWQRIIKLARHWDDGFGYGLFRAADIKSVRFPLWHWVNRERAYNNIYPTLYFYLARSNFKLVGTEPLWLNRIKTNSHHKIPFEGRFCARVGAAFLWKADVFAASAQGIFNGSRSPLLVIVSLPALICRMMADCNRELLEAFFALKTGKIEL